MSEINLLCNQCKEPADKESVNVSVPQFREILCKSCLNKQGNPEFVVLKDVPEIHKGPRVKK